MGRKIYCQPDSQVYHLGGGTLPKGNARKTYLNFRNNLTMLYKNLDQRELSHVLRIRRLLDHVAALQALLLNRRWDDCKAILRARRDFRRWQKDFEADRCRIQGNKVSSCSNPNSPFSILWQYYAKGRKHFSAPPHPLSPFCT